MPGGLRPFELKQGDGGYADPARASHIRLENELLTGTVINMDVSRTGRGRRGGGLVKEGFTAP